MNEAAELSTAEAAQLPVMIGPEHRAQDPVAWAMDNREGVEQLLQRTGGILLRGFRFNGVPHFERFIGEGFGRSLQCYRNPSTPRTAVRGHVYTSTEYPAEQMIPLHNENSYTASWAERIHFFCIKPAEHGGETPIADSRRVYARIDPAVRERFERHGVMYLRNYDGLDLPWQTVFQTDDPAEVERSCAASGIVCEWLGGGRLRTREVAQATLRHPVTGQPVWFNQAHLFHVSALDDEVAQTLLATLGEEALPRNALFGDGSTIDAMSLAAVRAAYAAEAVAFPWQAGDVLLLDNVLVAHGRRPYVGTRRVVVGMS